VNSSASTEFVTSDWVGHDPVIADRRGPAALIDQVKQIQKDFPDVRFDIEDLVAEGDKVLARWTARGSHYLIKRQVELTGMSLARFEDGRIAESWLERDSAALVRMVLPQGVWRPVAKSGQGDTPAPVILSGGRPACRPPRPPTTIRGTRRPSPNGSTTPRGLVSFFFGRIKRSGVRGS